MIVNKKFEELTTKDICSCIAIINAMCDEGILNIDLEKTKATIYADRLTKYLENQNVMLQNWIDKSTDILYCWGEVLDAEFQKKMLKTLKGGSDE